MIKSKRQPSVTNTTNAEVLSLVSSSAFYTKYEVTNQDIEDLERCATEIVRLGNTIQEAVIEIGQQLIIARGILGDRTTNKNKLGVKATRGTFTTWAMDRICTPLNLSLDTVQRWAMIAEEVNKHPERVEVIGSMQLSALYETLRPSFPEDLREAVLSSGQQTLNPKQIKEVKKLYQAAKAQERNITADAIVTLSEGKYEISNTALRHLSLIPSEEQSEFAKQLADDRNCGLQAMKDRLREIKVETQAELVTIPAKLQELPFESIDLIVVECPLGNAWKDSDLGLKQLADRLEDILVPGGFALIFLGHTSILNAASYLTNLKPLTLLTCRKQPGNSSTNVGVNLGYAAVHAMLCYKPNFRAPSRIVFDLQTFEATETPPSELGEVTTGIEAGICKFMDSLVEPGFNVAHLVLGNRSYGIRPQLTEKLRDLNAMALYLL